MIVNKVSSEAFFRITHIFSMPLWKLRIAEALHSVDTVNHSNYVQKLMITLLFDKRTFAILLKSYVKFFLRIHDDGASPRNGFADGLSSDEDKACPFVFGAHYYPIPFTLIQDSK
jgi:hypothetical protein